MCQNEDWGYGMLNEIMEKCDAMNVYEKRTVSDNYYELVFFSKELDEWEQFFTDKLGNVSKPSNVKPTKEDLSLTEGYGGICANQTLFKKECDDDTIIAMFWPWQDNIHITLKVALIGK